VGRTFSTSFLAGDPAARAFLSHDFRVAGTRVAGARAAAARRASPAILETLREQQAGLAPSTARDANLGALAEGRTAVVATGQQAGLFLGPLYSFYKAASAIAVARAIQAESGTRCVPLFWLQTEDHDFAEIASCHAGSEHGASTTLALKAETPGEARVSIAHRRLGPEVAGLVDALADTLAGALGTAHGAAEVVALVRNHYTAGRPVARAFAGLLAAIFAEEGLLILDPRDARVAAAAAPLYHRSLDRAGVIEETLRTRGAALLAAGFAEQIPVRAGCSLLFFHQGAATGPRFRMRRLPGETNWSLAGPPDVLRQSEIVSLLTEDPLRFSTSALLRPLVQDAVLPTVATVGGPAELAYFAQLDPVYAAFDMAPPLVIPRARFRLVDAPTRRRLAALGLSADDATRPRADLLTRLAQRSPAEGPDPQGLRRRAAEQITTAIDTFTRDVVAADGTLAAAAIRTRASVDHAVGRFVDRYTRNRAERDGIATARLDKIQRALAPGGIPQERFFGWPTFAARYGMAAFKHAVMDRLAADAFPTALLDIAP
jgi:bacillithiol synthase